MRPSGWRRSDRRRSQTQLARYELIREPTKKLWPGAFASDKVHPNSIGAEVMAQKWFETLLAHDGLAVPQWSRKEMEESIRRINESENPMDKRGNRAARQFRDFR